MDGSGVDEAEIPELGASMEVGDQEGRQELGYAYPGRNHKAVSSKTRLCKCGPRSRWWWGGGEGQQQQLGERVHTCLEVYQDMDEQQPIGNDGVRW